MDNYTGQPPANVAVPTQQPQVPANQTPAPAQQVPAQPAAQPQPRIETENPRTNEQFDKLIDSNKRLHEANEQMREQMQELTKTIQSPQVPETVNPADFVAKDPVTGEQWVDGPKLQNAINELEARAKKAEESVEQFVKSSEEREVRRQEQEAMAAHPEMNPANKDLYNQNFVKQARGLVLDSVMYTQDYGGKPLSFKEAADLIKSGSQPSQTAPIEQQPGQPVEGQPQGGQPAQVPVQGQQPAAPAPANPAQQAKANATAQNMPSAPQNAPTPTDSAELEVLRDATRHGERSNEAIAARLANIDHIIPFNGAGPTQ